MRRSRAIGAVLAAVVLAGAARAQDTGRMLEGFIGPDPALPTTPAPQTPPEPAETAVVAAEEAGPPLAIEPERAPVAAVESTPLGGSGQSAFRPRLGVGGESAKPNVSLRAGDGWWRTAGALAAIVALIFAVAAVVRRWGGAPGGLMHSLGAGGRAPSGLLYVLGRYPAGRGQTLVLLKLDRRVLLLCQSAGARGGGMRTLCELTDPEEVASIVMLAGEAEGRSLSARFREMMSGFEQAHDDAPVSLSPLEVPERPAAPARFESIGPDPAERLHSRLDTMRRAGWGASA